MIKAPRFPKPQPRGLTLLEAELLVFIFAMFALLTYSTFNNSYQADQQNKELDRISLMVNKIAIETEGTSVNDTRLGDYNFNLELIRVFAFKRDPRSVWSTCNHETAHHLDNYALHTHADRSYYDIFNNSPTLVRAYGNTSIFEYYAVTFEHAMQGCINMSKVPEDQRDHPVWKKTLHYFPECK